MQVVCFLFHRQLGRQLVIPLQNTAPTILVKTKPKGQGDTGVQPPFRLTFLLCRCWEQSLPLVPIITVTRV